MCIRDSAGPYHICTRRKRRPSTAGLAGLQTTAMLLAGAFAATRICKQRPASRWPRGRADDETRTGLWDRSIAPYPVESVSRASSIYRRCLAKVEEGSFHKLRDCPEIGRDALMPGLNVKYWKNGAGN